MATVDVVLFDVNETLVDFAPIGDGFTAVGLDPNRLDAWWRGVLLDGIAASAAGTFASFPDLLRHHLRVELAAAGRADDGATDRLLALFPELRCHPGVEAALRRLRDAEVAAVPFTNGSASIAQRALERDGLAELVHDCWDVAEVARWKPAADPYRWACDRFGAPPERVALIAVHPWDVHGALAAGLQGAWVDRTGDRRWPAYFHTPTVVGDELDDTLEQLLTG